MLDLDAHQWKTMHGGYLLAYDASAVLLGFMKSSAPQKTAWDELWDNLYHQHDVGIASYAVMPWLLKIYLEKGWIDYQLPTYAFAVEEARSKYDNPPIPDWLAVDYRESVVGLIQYCMGKRAECDDPNFKKAVVLLEAIMVGALDLAELVDFVEIWDEKRALKLYDAGI